MEGNLEMSMLQRRLFLLSLTTPLLAQTPSIDAVVAEYPTTIPGASKVVKHPTRGAYQLLVHIQQTHILPDDFPNDEKKVSLVQQDIYTILTHLAKLPYGKDIFPEACVEPYAQDTFNLIKQFRNSVGSYIGSLQGKRMDLYADLGAALLVAAEEKITIHAAETAQASTEQGDAIRAGIKALKAYKNGGSSDANNKALRRFDAAGERREDIVLDLVDRSGVRVAHTVFGALHDWQDNIARWNSKCPNKSYAFIVVTPESMRLYDKSK
jgi:hypothetical protein